MTNTNNRQIIGNQRRNAIGDAAQDPDCKAVLDWKSNQNSVDSGDFWRISGVHYRGLTYDVDLKKSLLEGGEPRSQDWLGTYSENAMSKNEFHTPDYPLLYGIISTLYSLREDLTMAKEVKEAHNFLKDVSKKSLITLTRVFYESSGSDDYVIHNFKTSRNYMAYAPFSGPDGHLSASDGLVCKALLDTSNVSEIKNVFKWFSGFDVYLIRHLNDYSLFERVARLHINQTQQRVDLFCYGEPINPYYSLGVRLNKTPGVK